MTLFTHIFETLVIVENMDATAASDRTLFRKFLRIRKTKKILKLIMWGCQNTPTRQVKTFDFIMT